MNVLTNKINANAVKDLQITQHFNAIYIEGSVPALAAGGMLTATTKITSYGDFLCYRMTGKYSTLVAGPADDGTCHLKMTIRDGTGGVDIFEDFIPLDLFCSPGRVRTMGVLADAAGGVPNPTQQLFYPMPLEYIFRANNDLTLQVKNDATYANNFSIAFWGVRLKSPAAVRGL